MGLTFYVWQNRWLLVLDESNASQESSNERNDSDEHRTAQLEHLKSLGFRDKHANLQALTQSNGDIRYAIGILNPPMEGFFFPYWSCPGCSSVMTSSLCTTCHKYERGGRLDDDDDEDEEGYLQAMDFLDAQGCNQDVRSVSFQDVPEIHGFESE